MTLAIIGDCMFQSHRVRKGDFNSNGATMDITARVLFQSHRVRKGDFNRKRVMDSGGRGCVGFNLIE